MERTPYMLDMLEPQDIKDYEPQDTNLFDYKNQ